MCYLATVWQQYVNSVSTKCQLCMVPLCRSCTFVSTLPHLSNTLIYVDIRGYTCIYVDIRGFQAGSCLKISIILELWILLVCKGTVPGISTWEWNFPTSWILTNVYQSARKRRQISPVLKSYCFLFCSILDLSNRKAFFKVLIKWRCAAPTESRRLSRRSWKFSIWVSMLWDIV